MNASVIQLHKENRNSLRGKMVCSLGHFELQVPVNHAMVLLRKELNVHFLFMFFITFFSNIQHLGAHEEQPIR